jgi:hypothetical protein
MLTFIYADSELLDEIYLDFNILNLDANFDALLAESSIFHQTFDG